MNIPSVTKRFNVNELQPILNHQAPQQSRRRTGDGDGEANKRNEPITRERGRVVREFIENHGAESYYSELVERLESEELEKNYHLKKRPKREEVDINQKLERLKEQRLAKLGARDNSNPCYQLHPHL